MMSLTVQLPPASCQTSPLGRYISTHILNTLFSNTVH